jgi:plasmid maintenance system antidote protein VapI
VEATSSNAKPLPPSTFNPILSKEERINLNALSPQLGKRAITADTDLRLARHYKISEGLFLGLQTDYNLRIQRRVLENSLEFIKPRAA